MSPATIACHICSILYVLKYLHKEAAPKYDVAIINQLRGVATSLQRQGNNYMGCAMLSNNRTSIPVCINYAASTLHKLHCVSLVILLCLMSALMDRSILNIIYIRHFCVFSGDIERPKTKRELKSLNKWLSW